MGIALNLRSIGCGFKSYSGQCCVTTLGKLFTPMCLCDQAVSCVCAVPQYTVLEASSKVNGIGEILYPLKPFHQFGCRFKDITTSSQGVDLQNLIKINSAVTTLRMRESLRGVFCLHIRLSILRHAYRSHF